MTAGSTPVAPLRSVLTDGAWTGRRAFCVGGGPSLRGFNFKRLDGELWIGCNMAFLERPTIAFSICHRFMRDVVGPGGPHEAAWRECPSLKVFMDPPRDLLPSCAAAGVLTIGNCVGAWGRTLVEGVTQGPLSGIVAANLADILRPDMLYLLGHDCRIAEDGAANYHTAYWWNQDGKVRPKETRYANARANWAKFAPQIRSRVVLLGDSALECFERGRLEDVLP